MKVLITGGSGFVGKYLAKALFDDGHEVTVTKMPSDIFVSEVKVVSLDILDRNQVNQVLTQEKPQWIFHLAAQSSVALSWKNPLLTIDVNIKGVVNLLDSVREVLPEAKVLLVGSGEEYGHILPDESPVSEENALRPGNIYAATKVEQNLLGRIYAKAYNLHIMMTRSFNHIGPGQSAMFVAGDFCQQVAKIEAGRQDAVIMTGNLSAKRDFTDVQDVVRAYILLMEKGKSGETYNVGSGNAISIEELLAKILSFSNVPIAVKVDVSKLRPVDVPVIEADISKINRTTGWTPEISIENTLEQTLNYWRSEVN